jgi:hypothetical protein
MTRLARCDKLWEKRSREARRMGIDEEGQQDEARTETDCRMDKDAEILIFRKHQYEENPMMEVSGEDIQMVMECDHCGPEVTECLLTECDDCGTSWVREHYTMTVIGNDVVSLFPSLDSVNTGRIVREEVEKSTINIDGFNVRLGLKYIAMNEEYTGDLEPIRKLLPFRVTKPGVKPGMKSKWVNCKEVLADDDWVYPPMQLTEVQRRQIIGRVA